MIPGPASVKEKLANLVRTRLNQGTLLTELTNGMQKLGLW